MSKILKLFLLFLGFEKLLASEQENRITIISSLIRDVAENDDKHSSLWLKNCWSKSENLKFLKSTNRSYMLLQNGIETDVKWNEYNRQIQHFWFAIDLSCEDSLQFLMNTNTMYFTHPFRWILIDGNKNIYEKLVLPTDSNVVIAESANTDGHYVLKQG